MVLKFAATISTLEAFIGSLHNNDIVQAGMRCFVTFFVYCPHILRIHLHINRLNVTMLKTLFRDSVFDSDIQLSFCLHDADCCL